MSKSPAKPRLGRGLTSLISVSELPVEVELPAPPSATARAGESYPSAPPTPSAFLPGVEAREIPVDEITPNPHQPRREFDPTSLAELAASLKSTGLIQPIIVRHVEQGYQLIAGERRLRAAKLAGLERVPALIRDVDSLTQAQMALVENIQREDLNPVDRALAYRTLVTSLGLTQGELAGRLGEDRTSVTHFLRLLDLTDGVREMVRQGKLTVGHGKLLAGITDAVRQVELADRCVSQGLSVRNLERILEGPDTPAGLRNGSPIPASAHLQDLEKSIGRQLGMRVQVRSGAKKGRGRLIIHYSSLDEFDQLMERMHVQADAE